MEVLNVIIVGYSCDKCKHQTELKGYIPTCKAFPEGIPNTIYDRPLNSREECANGYKYESDPEKVALFAKFGL